MKIVHPVGLIGRTSAAKLFAWFASPRGGMWPAIGPLHSDFRNPMLSAPRNPAQPVDKWLIVEAMKIDWHTMTNDSMNLICCLACFVVLCFPTILGELFWLGFPWMRFFHNDSLIPSVWLLQASIFVNISSFLRVWSSFVWSFFFINFLVAPRFMVLQSSFILPWFLWSPYVNLCMWCIVILWPGFASLSCFLLLLLFEQCKMQFDAPLKL